MSKLPSFEFELACDASPDVAWARLWDLRRHTDAIPLTEVTSSDGQPLHQGSRFTGRTRLGPILLLDRMVVREWDAPRRTVIEKVGPWFRGIITVDIREAAPGCRVTWRQSYGARLVPRPLARLLRRALRRGYRSTVTRILEPSRERPGS